MVNAEIGLNQSSNFQLTPIFEVDMHFHNGSQTIQKNYKWALVDKRAFQLAAKQALSLQQRGGVKSTITVGKVQSDVR